MSTENDQNPSAIKSQVDNMLRASTAAVKSVQTVVKTEVAKRFASTVAKNVKSLEGKHFMSIDKLRYVPQDQMMRIFLLDDI